jgi:hypothetical protein
VDLAEAFERETGCALHERDLFGLRMLVPEDDRLGAFGIVIGERPDVVFPVRSYGNVHVVVWRANEKALDKTFRRILSAAA